MLGQALTIRYGTKRDGIAEYNRTSRETGRFSATSMVELAEIEGGHYGIVWGYAKGADVDFLELWAQGLEDEFEYYQNQEDKKDNSLVQDIQHLAKLKFGEMLSGKLINIRFYTFGFMGRGNRPYNAGVKNIEMMSKSQLF